MKKVQYAIVGFVIGIMSGLLLGLIEMKLLKRFQSDTIMPFVIGATVMACAVTGVIMGVKYARKTDRK